MPAGPDRTNERFSRPCSLERLRNERFDVLVVGGGITGAGVALDAASRGLKTALVERHDFASGTSSKSSKMVHGGLRYLQQREFRLVYENLAERQRLLDNAPHLVSPLPFLIPLFGRGGVVAKALTRSYSSALWLYDLTGGLRIGSRHRRIGRDEALGHLPSLRADRLVSGFVYLDARADDARLTLELLRTAALDHGAVVANRTPVVGLLGAGRLEGATVAPEGEEPFDVAASSVVNATGVWADQVEGLAGPVATELRPAKGVHVSVPMERLPADVAAVVPVPEDRRAIFVVPWPEADRVYIGTTDTSYDGPLDDPGCTPEDVDYLLRAVNAVTTASLTRRDVTAVWAGLRPLLAPPTGSRISERTADLSRRHSVTVSARGLVTVTGGKLTTYRKMAEDAVDAVGELLGQPRPCRTKKLRLRGAKAGPPSRLDTLPAPVATHLRRRYGSEAEAVLAVAHGRPELLEPLAPGLTYLRVEAAYGAHSEMALSVSDVLERRTRAALEDGELAARAADEASRLMASELGWDEGRASTEADAAAASIRRNLERAGVGPGAEVPAPPPR